MNSMILDVKLPIGPHANHRLRTNLDYTPAAVALVPAEAVAWVQALRQGGKKIHSIELCGPGDVLASARTSLACLELLQPEVQDAELSLTSLGLGSIEVAPDLARLGVQTVNLLVDTVTNETAMKLYSWIRPGKNTVPLPQATEMLINGQSEAAQALQAVGIKVVIRTTVVPGINENEIPAIAQKMSGLGATAMEIGRDDTVNLEKLLAQASIHLPTTVYHPAPELPPPGMPHSCRDVSMPKPTPERPNVAVVSTNGMDVDMHLGQASQVLIYGPREDGLASLLLTRKTPASGAGPSRWQKFAQECLHDCFALLASHAGDVPRKEFAELGIQVILTEDNIEGLVDVLYGGGKKKKCK